MNFIPLTEEELQISALLPEGIYEYKIIKSEDKISQAGNEYISLVLKIIDNNGVDHAIFTNLALIKLLKHFCDVNNMQDNYKSGNVPAEMCLNKSGGRVIIGIEGEKSDGKGGVYRAKNIVKDYIAAFKESSLLPLKETNAIVNDDIPF